MKLKRNRTITPIYHPIIFAILFISLFTLYANTLEFPFIFDDAPNIEKNFLLKIEELSFEKLSHVAVSGPNKRRVLPNISFALNYYFGGSEVFGYHLVNIIIHISAAFVFYLLARTTLNLPVLAGRFQRSTEIAFTAALLWALHPLQTNGVTYIVQRMTSMATLFFLLAMLCYVKARITEETWERIMLWGATILLGVMAIFSKENSGMLPVMILGYEFFLLAGPAQDGKSRKTLLILSVGALAAFLVICLLFLGSNPFASILSGYGAREFTLGQRLLTETRIVIHYLSLLILPLPARLNLAYNYQLSTGLLTPPATLLAIISLAGLTGLIFFLYRKNRLAAFSIFWLLGNLMVESSFIPLELVFEHRMYMPSMFIILATTAWFYSLTVNRMTTVRLTTVAAMLVLALFTWQRNSVWKDSVTLWTDAIQKAPGSVRALVNLGIAYSHADQLDRSEASFLKAIELDPTDGFTYFNLGTTLEKQQRYAEAVSIYKKAVGKGRVNSALLNYNLALVYQKLNDYNNSIMHANMALSRNPLHYNSYIVLGRAYFKTGNYRAAEQTFNQALKYFPYKGDLYVNLGAVYEHRSMLQQALSLIGTGLSQKDVNKAQAYNILGIVYWRLKKLPDSASAARQAIEIDPELLDAYITLGITYEEMGRQDLAFAEFGKAWEKGYDMVATYNYWAVNFMRQNDPDRAIMYLEEAIRLNPDHAESRKNLEKALLLKKQP